MHLLQQLHHNSILQEVWWDNYMKTRKYDKRARLYILVETIEKICWNTHKSYNIMNMYSVQ